MKIQETSEKKELVILAGVHTGRMDRLNDTDEISLKELEELTKTAGGEVAGVMLQNRPDIENATYLGEGKLEELKEAVDNLEADTVIFDDELSPIQLRNITDRLGVKVIDRAMLILDIFSMHARTGEGKLQVELAQLKYRLPRLRGMGAEMSRTGAGIGTRGPGETRLETDRRHIHRRISALEQEIAEIKKHRSLIRERRTKDGFITAALVGYTNAGKSTLLNALTDADVYAKDKLFATLDPTSRGLTLEDNRTILLTDTVGFIRKLPHHLIEAFKSTLEEAKYADLLLHVIDTSSEEFEDQIEIVESVLSDIGAADKPIIGVYNKCDISDTDVLKVRNYEKNISISAKKGINLDELLKAIADVAPGKKKEIRVCLPYAEGSLLPELHTNQKIITEEYTGDGIELKLLVDEKTFDRLKKYIITE